MPVDVDPLPTLGDDQKIQDLRASIDSLESDIDAATAALPGAKEDVQTLQDELAELEVEQYADPDVTESDVQAKRNALETAKEDVARLQKEKENKREALSRVRKEIEQERTAAGRRLYGDYTAAERDVADEIAQAATTLRSALENANELREKARSNNVEPGPTTTDPHLRKPTSARREPGVDSRYDDVLMTLLNRLIEEEEEQAAEFGAAA
jgi:chromosome segregation ATPase